MKKNRNRNTTLHTIRESIVKSRVFSVWLLTYLVVLIIPLIFSLFMFKTSSDLVRNNTETINGLTLDQTSSSVGRIYSDVNSMARQLLNQREVTSLSYADMPLNTYKRETIGDLQKKIKEQTAYSLYIREIYVYFGGLELSASSTRGMISKGSFFSQIYNEFNISEKNFWEWVDSPDNNKIRLVPNKNKKASNIALISSVGSGYLENDAICLVILSPEVFTNLLGDDNENHHILISDSITDTYLYRNQSADLIAQYAERDPTQEIFSDGNETYQLISLTDDATGWEFTSAMPIKQYTSQINNIRNIYFAFVFACLLLGVLISVIFTHRNYAPVKKLSILADSQNFKRENTNEFDYLENSFSNLIETKASYEKEISDNRLALRQTHLRRMLQGNLFTKQSYEAVCSDYHINFSTDKFFVIAVKILDYKGPETDKIDFYLNQSALSKSSEIINEALEDCFDSYSCILGDILYVISSFKKEDDSFKNPENDAEMIYSLTAKFHVGAEQVSKNDDLTLMFYVSETYLKPETPVASIHAAYKECSWAFSQIDAFNIEKLATNKASLQQEIYSLSRETEQSPLPDNLLRRQFTQYISKGKATEAKQMLPQLMQGGITTLNHEFWYLRMHCIYLADYLVSNMEGDQSKNYSDEIQMFLTKILETQNLKELNSVMKDLVDLFCSASKKKPAAETENALYLDMVKYIDDNFRDPNLTVASMTNHFGLSHSYLSRVFKKDSGNGILDYIHQKRVDESKQLLKNTGRTIADIAENIGYSNQLALIRAFKRLEGITPSEYRNLS